MKKIMTILLCVTMAIFLMGCKATPDESVVIGKGDGQLEEKIVAHTDAPLPSDMPETGKRINEVITNDKGSVELSIYAQVVRYDALSFPASVVKPEKFTQLQANKVIKALVGEEDFYAPGQISIATSEQSYKSACRRRRFLCARPNKH